VSLAQGVLAMTVKMQIRMLEQLKKQVTALKRKEKLASQKLRTALVKVKKITKVYQGKLEKKKRDTKAKVAAAKAAVYEEIASSIKKKAKVSKLKAPVKKAKKPIRKSNKK
jgi:hypothetical protein